MADGKPVTGPGRQRLVMFQESALFPWLNVLGNVLFGLKLKPHLANKDRRDVARYYLELVGLTRFERANIHELSGGMKQRVASGARARAESARAFDGRTVRRARRAHTRTTLRRSSSTSGNRAVRPSSSSRTTSARPRVSVIGAFSSRPPGAQSRRNLLLICRARATSTAVDLAEYASQIMRSLKGFTATGGLCAE